MYANPNDAAAAVPPKPLYFMPSAPDADRLEVATLVQKYYRGLLERGEMSWADIHASRSRRAGGMDPETAATVIEGFNLKLPPSVREERWLSVDNMRAWPSNKVVFDQKAKDEGDGGDAAELRPIPSPPPPDDRQLVFGIWGKEVARFDFTDQYIVGPWGEPTSEDGLDTSYNILLNIAMATLAVGGDSTEYPLRFMLPGGDALGPALNRTQYTYSEKDELVAVLLLKFDATGSKVYDRPPHVDRGFVPLFVFKMPHWSRTQDPLLRLQRTFENFKLLNYRGDLVDWGDYSKRKKVTYYELRDTMAHLTAHAPNPWTMLRVEETVGAVREHYLVRKTLGDAAEADKLRREAARGLLPVCVQWDERGSVRIVRRSERPPGIGWRSDRQQRSSVQSSVQSSVPARCEYDGDKADFVRPPLSFFDRMNGTNYSGNNASASTPTADIRRLIALGTDTIAEGAVPHRIDLDRRMFGLYGDYAKPGVRKSETFDHLTTAAAYWQRQRFNPLLSLVWLWGGLPRVRGAERRFRGSMMTTREDADMVWPRGDQSRGDQSRWWRNTQPEQRPESRLRPQQRPQSRSDAARWGGDGGESRDGGRLLLGLASSVLLVVAALMPRL
jgi:hypothetical protein